MQSVCRRRSESSAERRMWDFDSPFFPSPMSMPTLVATMTLFLFPLLFIHSPRIISDSPPVWPGIHLEYTSAVSTELKPAATNASSNLNEAAWSTVHPKTFPPKTRGDISIPVLPSFRFFILPLSFALRVYCHALDEITRRNGTRLASRIGFSLSSFEFCSHRKNQNKTG